MTLNLEAVYFDGQLKLEGSLALAEGTRVRVEITPLDDVADPLLLVATPPLDDVVDPLDAVIGICDDGPPFSLAEHHDAVVYGLKPHEGPALSRWQFLIARPHRWRRQLSIKGSNMTVGQLISTVRANRYTPEQASEELEFPLAAINEALAYYAENRDLIAMEASEERRFLSEQGYPLEPKDLPRSS